MAATDRNKSMNREQKLQSLVNSSNEDEFSIAEYLNTAGIGADDVRYEDEEEEEERRMTELALQLQLQTQSCHDEIGRCMVEVGAMIPRLTADVNRIGVGLNGMREDALTLMNHHHQNSHTMIRSEFEHDSYDNNHSDHESQEDDGKSLQLLSNLHALRENLVEVRSILQAASSWESTVISMHELIATVGETVDSKLDSEKKVQSSSVSSEDSSVSAASLAKAVDVLSQLEYGAKALHDTPGSEERSNTIVAFRTKIEILLKPLLLHALQISSSSLGPLQQCVSMYKTLNKLDILKIEYVKSRPANVHKLWFTFTPSNNTVSGTNHTNERFVEWLPTWYEACLGLISEERRRSAQVFGEHDAPTVTGMILEECFRPLLSSFSSRLSSFSNEIDSICVSYKETLSFISIAYDQIVGIDLSSVETLFLCVVTPFLPYIQNFIKRESTFSSNMINDLRKKVNDVMTNHDIKELQSTVNQISHLSLDIFPIVQASFSRFETFTCGCDLRTYMQALDSMVYNHINEIAITISTLSAALIRHYEDSIQLYDEQDVQTLLESLTIPGRLNEKLSKFGILVLERSRSLLMGIKTSSQQTKNGAPDSYSPSEVGVLIARNSIGKHNDQKYINEIELYLETKQVYQIPRTFESIDTLAKMCRQLVFEACFAVPRKWLGKMHCNAEWAELASDNEDIISSYSILPQPYITHIGEHILALVQVLEPFATNKDSLVFTKIAMTDLNKVSKESWIELGGMLGYVIEDNDQLDLVITGKNLPSFIDVPNYDDDDENEDLDESHKFCNEWLDAVSTAVVGRMIEKIFRIDALSSKGLNHLATDLGYIVNVFSALGIINHPHPLLFHLSRLASLPKNEFEAELANRSYNDQSKTREAMNIFESRFAKIRRGV